MPLNASYSFRGENKLSIITIDEENFYIHYVDQEGVILCKVVEFFLEKGLIDEFITKIYDWVKENNYPNWIAEELDDLIRFESRFY